MISPEVSASPFYFRDENKFVVGVCCSSKATRMCLSFLYSVALLDDYLVDAFFRYFVLLRPVLNGIFNVSEISFF